MGLAQFPLSSDLFKTKRLGSVYRLIGVSVYDLNF